MKYAIEVSARAKCDLRGIYEYIAFELLAPENAGSQLNRLEKGIMELASMPFRFRKYETEPWKSRGLRIMSIDNFVVLYLPNKETAVVTIIRVMYGGRNIDVELNGSTDL